MATPNEFLDNKYNTNHERDVMRAHLTPNTTTQNFVATWVQLQHVARTLGRRLSVAIVIVPVVAFFFLLAA